MKLKLIVYYSFIQLLLPAITASGQKILYPVLNPANSRFDNLEIDKGRGGATVYSLLQDNRGFIWCGTDGGLYRYDGTRYIRFYYGDSDTTIYGNIALSMLNDNSGAMWVGTHGGLSLIHQDKRQISHFIPDTANLKSADNSIRLIRKDKKGNIWLITDWNIFRLDHDTHIFRKFATDTLPLHSIEVAFTEDKDKFIEDNNGYIWIATNKGLFQYNYDSDQWKKIYPSANAAGNINPRVNCIKADNNGDLWFGTEYDGLFRIIEPEKGLYEHVLMITREGLNNEVAPITSVLTGDDEDLWFTTDTTLCRINILNRKMTEYIFSDAYGNPRNWKSFSRLTRMIRGSGDEIWLLNYVNGIVFKFNSDTEKISSYMVPRFIVFDALLDTTGNLWTGCVASNIFILVTSGLPYVSRTLPNITGVSLSNSQLLEEDSQGNIIVLTNNSIIKLNNTVDDFGLIPEKSSELNYKDLKPLCIFRDSKLNLWLSFSDGIIRKYDPDDRFIRNYLLPVEIINIPENSIKFIREDSNGNLWFASFDGDIFILPDKVSEISLAIRTDELTNEKKITEILDFNIDMENKLWISTLKNIYRIDPVKQIYEDFTGFNKTGNLYQFYCRIYIDHSQRLWILTTLGSPFYYDHQQNTFISPYQNELVPDLGFFDMQIDRKGRMWMVDNNLITAFDTASKTSVSYPWFMNGNSVRSYISDSGNIYYLTHNQIIAFRPERSINKFVPPIYFTRLLINSTDYFYTLNMWPNQDLSKVMLPYKKNYLKIEFASLNYIKSDLNKYRFYMKGIDKDTTIASSVPYAEYRGMPPGDYTFWVTGSNNDGIWNQDGVTLDIRIYPPWYKSVFAYIAYLLIFVLSIIVYIRFRIYRLTRDKERLEKEVRSRTEELEIKNKQLAEIDRIKTQFFTDISHEIRTPLTLITGPIDILTKTFEGNDKVSGMLAAMKRNSDRLMQLVNELLDIVRLDAGKMKITLIEDDIISNLRMLVYEFLSLAESKKIRYIVEIPDSPLITWFDSYKLNIIITNLLSNAFRYTPSEGTVRCIVKIEINDLDQNKKYITNTVSDTGRGISKEHIERIFERFYRVEGHHESDGHGTGIGLSMVKEFINLLHGEIKVDSTPGKGSSFTVKIPLGKDHLSESEFVITESRSEPSRPPAITRAELQLENLTGPRHGNLAKILLIEDNADLRNFIIENLSDSYHLLEADNGKTGLGLAYSMIPDLIISDIMMPDFDGIQLCSKLKNDVRTSHIPIILLTAKATTDDKLTGLKSGADDYIFKPFNMDELKTRLANLLTTRERLKQKYLDPKSLEKIEENNKSVDDLFMEKVIRLIKGNISNFDFDVASLHYSLGMSRMHLSRKLKALTGISPHLLINRIRMEKAAELLRLNRGNITEIANSVGISNPANFSRSFREHFGTSPKSYMKQFRSSDKSLL